MSGCFTGCADEFCLNDVGVESFAYVPEQISVTLMDDTHVHSFYVTLHCTTNGRAEVSHTGCIYRTHSSR